MAWGRLEDKLHDNDKLGAVSDSAFRLWVLALSWSNDKRTDGHVPTQRPARLLTMRKPEKTIGELLEAHLWHRASAPCAQCVRKRAEAKADPIPSGGYVVHDYFDYNKPRWAIEADRVQRREQGRLGGLVSASVRSSVGSSAGLSVGSSVDSSQRSSVDSSQTPEKGKRGLNPVPRTPVAPYPESFSSRTRRGAGDPDEPAIPDEPGRSKERGDARGLRHIGESIEKGAARGAR